MEEEIFDRVLAMRISDRVEAQLIKLRTATKAPSLTDVIRRSLALYDLAIEHRDEGGQLVFRHKDGTEEVLAIQ